MTNRFTMITVHTAGGAVDVTGERTDTPGLAIAPGIGSIAADEHASTRLSGGVALADQDWVLAGDRWPAPAVVAARGVLDEAAWLIADAAADCRRVVVAALPEPREHLYSLVRLDDYRRRPAHRIRRFARRPSGTATLEFVGGGEIRFIPANSDAGRGIQCDTLLLVFPMTGEAEQWLRVMVMAAPHRRVIELRPVASTLTEVSR